MNLAIKQFKNYLEDKTLEFIHITKRFKNSNKLPEYSTTKKEAENQLDKIKEDYSKLINDIEKGIYKLTRSLEDLKYLDWDKLNIVFFGETNAGKSTLIEALIGGDGRSIGDGRKDFTKNYKILPFSEDVNLIDTPGIEGNEREVKNSIKRAVNKAHVVFYIFSNNKEPEEGTLKKIKSFLNEHTYIYGVINIRISAKNKDDFHKKLVGLQIIEKRSREKLTNIFGNRFKGIIKVHALYAFYARAKGFSPSSKEVVFVSRDRAKRTVESFGGKDKLEDVSNVNSLIEEINKLKNGQQFKLKLLWSNTRKILNRQERIVSNILRNKKDIDSYIKGLEEAFKKLSEKYRKEKEVLKRNIYSIIRTRIAELEKELRDKVYGLIDKDIQDENIWKKAINNVATEKGKQIEDDIKNELKDFEKKTKKEIELLKEKIEGLSRYISKYKPLDFDEIVKSLKIHMWDILKEVGDVALKVISVILASSIGNIVAIILSVFFLFKKIFDWIWKFWQKKDKKAEAKRKANKEIKKKIKQIEKELRGEIKQTIYEIDKSFREVRNAIKKESAATKHVSLSLNDIVRQLMFIHQEISEEFLKTLDPKVEFGYIQTTIREGDHVCAVCPSENLRDKLIGCGIENISIYKNGEDMLSDIKEREEEFFKRLRNFLKSKELNYGKES